MRTSASTWLEWPRGPIRVGVVFLVTVAAVAAAVRLPGAVEGRLDAASRNDALSYADREIAGGNGLVLDQMVVYEARGRIPLDEPYHVAVGDGFDAGNDLTVPHVANFFQYFLMPRRPAEDAPWVICYGCDLAQYGNQAKVVWQNDDGISIVRTRP